MLFNVVCRFIYLVFNITFSELLHLCCSRGPLEGAYTKRNKSRTICVRDAPDSRSLLPP